MFDQEAFLRHRIEKAQDQLKRLRRDNHEKEMARVMFQAMGEPRVLENMGVHELNDLGWLIDQYSVDVQRRLERLAEAKAKEEAQVAAPEQPAPRPVLTDQHGFLEMMMYQDQIDPVVAMDKFWSD